MIKKSINFLILAVIVLTLFVGCSSEGKTPSIEEINNNIVQATDISEMRVGDAKKLEKLYGIDAEKLESFFLYTPPSNIEADEIAILKVKNSNDIDSIKEKISKRINDKEVSFKDYLPDEYYLVEKHVLKNKDSYIIFVTHNDYKIIEETFDKCF